MVYKKKKSVPLGDNIKLMMEDSGVTEEQIGEKIGIKQPQVNRLLNRSNSKVDVYYQIAEDVFDCAFDEMAGYHKTRFLKKADDDKQ